MAESAELVATRIREAVDSAQVEPVATTDDASLRAALEGVEVVVAAGGAGVCLLPKDIRVECPTLRLAIDLNAVPPEGIEGVRGPDAGKDRDGVTAYGAIGVGGLKMKIHRAAIAKLFEASDQVFDAEEIFDLGMAL